MFRITKKNYEGYYELGKIKLLDPLKYEKYAKRFAKIELVMFILFILLVSFNVSLGIILPIIPCAVAIVTTYRNYSKKIKKLKEKYPYVDDKISKDELTKGLEDANILKYEKKNNIINYVLDKEGYLELLEEIKTKNEYIDKCNTIKNEVLRNHKIVQDDFSISDEELEKVKVKIKTLVRNRD